jgi:hypothetical protein
MYDILDWGPIPRDRHVYVYTQPCCIIISARATLWFLLLLMLSSQVLRHGYAGEVM